MRRDGELGAAGVKTWGPFTGRQLSTMVCVLLVTIMLPVGAFAVTGNNVFVADPTTGVQAKVNGAGQLSAAVTGSVTATPAAPSSTFVHVAVVDFVQGSQYQSIFIGAPAGKALVITGISVNPYQPSFQGDTRPAIMAFRTVGATCSAFKSSIGALSISTASSTALAYPSGVAIGQHALCAEYVLGAIPPTGWSFTFTFTINGYWIPATQCQALNVCY